MHFRQFSRLFLGWSMHIYSQLGDAPAFLQAGACTFINNSAMLQPSSRLEHVFLQPTRRCSNLLLCWCIKFYSQPVHARRIAPPGLWARRAEPGQNHPAKTRPDCEKVFAGFFWDSASGKAPSRTTAEPKQNRGRTMQTAQHHDKEPGETRNRERDEAGPPRNHIET